MRKTSFNRNMHQLGYLEGIHSDAEINTLISKINSLVTTLPSNSTSNVLNSPTTFQSPFNTVQGLMTSYAKGLCGQNCGYNDQDYTVLSQALSNLQQISAQMQQTMLASSTIVASSALNPAYVPTPALQTSGNTILMIGILGISLLIIPIILFKWKH